MKFIHEFGLKLIIIFALFSGVSCNESNPINPFREYKKITLTTESGTEIQTYVAKSADKQRLGLSFVQPSDFNDDDAMLFTGETYKMRQFWMPETFFNLDIFFLGSNFEILDVHRNIQHYTKRTPQEAVPLSKVSYCQHVLELKATSPISKSLKVGDKLKSSESL